MLSKRGGIKKKEILLFVIVEFIFLVSFQLVSADLNSYSKISLEKWTNNLSQENKNILKANIEKYEPRVLEEFAKLKYPEENQTKTNETFIRIIIILNDKSKADDVFSSFSENELKGIVNRPTSEGIGAKVSEKGFFELVKNEKIGKIFFNRKLYFSLDESAPLINADDAWNTLGYTGDGVKVCVIDSGVDTDHSDLSGKIADEYCYCDDNCCPDNTDEDDSAEDDNGHGTHVIGIIASQDSTDKGIAYDANIYVVKVGIVGDALETDVDDAITWCINQGVDVISISMGDGENHPRDSTCPEYLDTYINNAYNDDIPVIIASGNDKYDDGINYPACSTNAISVGATYDADHGYEGYPYGWIPIYCIDWSADEDTIPCFSNTHGGLLDLLAPGCKITSTWNDGGFDEKCGTSMAAPHIAGAAALLLEKDSSLDPDDILSTLQNTGVNVEGWKRIDVESALNDICVCDDWSSGSCGGGSCESNERYYTRSCTDNCDDESKCEYDASCEGGTPSGITDCDPDSCDGGYDDEGESCYWDGNYWTCKRTCHRDAYCGSYGTWNWEGNYRDVGVGDDNTWFYSPSVSTDTSHCYKFYARSDLYIDEWDPGGILHLDAESVDVYAGNDWDESSECSGDQSSPTVETTPVHTLGQGTGSSYYGKGGFIPYKSESCSGGTAYGLEGTLYTYMFYQTATYYPEDTQYKYCDVPYTNDIDLENTIYSDENADCDIEVQGSESYPEKIKVRWYVNGDRVETDYCDDGSSYDECDDDSGSTWSHTFELDDSEFEKDDEIYCIGRGYGEDGGHGAYDESDTTVVSNSDPTWSSINLDKSYAKQGDNIKVTASGEADVDSDTLAMYCCNGPSCTPTTSAHDFCYVTGDSSPYNLYCTGQGLSGDGTKTVRCRIYDGDDYSTIKSDTYTADNTAPDITDTQANITTANLNEYVRVNCTATDSGVGIDTFLIEADKPVSANENYSTTLLIGNTYYADIQLTESGIWNFNCWVNDTLNNLANKTGSSVDVSGDNPPNVTLISPPNNNISTTGIITFNCSATDDFDLDNITLYHNISGAWQKNETKTLTGTEDYETFTINNIPDDTNFIWNCLAYDNNSQFDWGDANYTVTINITEITPTIGIDLIYPTSNINVTQSEFFNFTTKVCCYDSNCGEINISLDPESEKVTYTPSTETHCKGNVCTKTLYSGIRFIYEDNKWKKREEARSFRGSPIKCAVISDNKHFADCVDWNETSRTIEFHVKEQTNVNKNIPLRKYNIKSGKRIYDKSFERNLKFSSVNNKKTYTYKVNPGDVLEFGEHSTTIVLDEPDTETLEDAYFAEAFSKAGNETIMLIDAIDGQGSIPFFKFNISAIPANSIIENAILCLHTSTSSDENIDVWGVANQTWREEEIDDLCGNGVYCSDIDNMFTTHISSGNGADTMFESLCLNVTNGVITDYNAGNINSSFALNNTGDPNDYYQIYSKEYGIAADRPSLNITYTEAKEKGLINTTTGAKPFYTNGTNPTTITLNQDECQNITWWVNATGDTGVTHTFFAYANKTSDMSISNKTSEVNITIQEVLQDTTSPTYSNNKTYPTSPTTYQKNANYQFNITWTDNTAIDTVIIEHNFTGTSQNYTITTNVSSEYYYDYSDLAAGTYSYRWYANDTSNNLNQTDSFTYTINKATSLIYLYLNSSRSNITIEEDTSIGINATLQTGQGTIQIIKNGTVINQGTSPLYNYTLFDSDGLFNITGFYPETQNYSSSFETWWVNVTLPTPSDTWKFHIRNSSGNSVAWFGNFGNLVLKGTLTQNTTPTPTANDEFRFRTNGNDVMLIDTTNGSMYIKGFLYENQGTLTPSDQSDDFIVRNASSDVVAYVNESGYLFLKGKLYENSNP